MGGDQREEDEPERNSVFMFDPQNGVFPKHKHMVPEVYHLKTKEALLPPKDGEGEAVTVKDISGITLSFHCENMNQIKAYCWWDGHGMRFEPQDLNKFWPVWFDDDYTWNDMEQGARYTQFMADEAVQKEVESLSLTDLHFVDFKRAWTMKRSRMQ